MRTKSVTKNLKIHGSANDWDQDLSSSWYGSDEELLNKIIDESPETGQYISEKLNIKAAQVILAVHSEMARTIEDVLARRTRALQLDAAESIRMAPAVANLMAQELKKDQSWQESQIEQFTSLARGYLIN